MLNQGRSEIERLGLGGPRELEREAGGIVAVLRSLWAFDDGLGQRDLGQIAGLLGTGGCFLNHNADVVFNHGDSDGALARTAKGPSAAAASRTSSSKALRACSITSGE